MNITAANNRLLSLIGSFLWPEHSSKRINLSSQCFCIRICQKGQHKHRKENPCSDDAGNIKEKHIYETAKQENATRLLWPDVHHRSTTLLQQDSHSITIGDRLRLFYQFVRQAI